jgi:hypothetical protein
VTTPASNPSQPTGSSLVDTGDTAHRMAAAARSILACPADVQLVVDGVSDICAGLDTYDPNGEPVLLMQEIHGTAAFSCPPRAALAVAAHAGSAATLTVRSGLGTPDSTDREATSTLTGNLQAEDGHCGCCDEPRINVLLTPDLVVLGRAGSSGLRLRIRVADYRSPTLDLNRGFLQRSTEHANACHQTELRHAVATRVGRSATAIAGVHLAGLRPDGVEIRWVDHTGAHSLALAFGATAANSHELGEMLRASLHAGLC